MWISDCGWKYGSTEAEGERIIKKVLATCYYRYKHGQWIGRTDAEVDVYLACKALGLKYGWRGCKRITRWLNGER